VNVSRPAGLARRGPGTGLRQARTAGEAAQWRSLFDALASPAADRALPHLGLRATDGPALRDVAARGRESLSSILAETRGQPELLARVNLALAEAYAELERQQGARLARCVFALSADGFPGAQASELMASWDASLRALADAHGGDLPAAKRDIVVAVIGHHLASVEPLDALAAAPPLNGAASTAKLAWLLALARWRRHATVRRALARVLTPGEQKRLAVFARPGRARGRDPLALPGR